MKKNNLFKKYESQIAIFLIFIGWVCLVWLWIFPAGKKLKEDFNFIEMKKIDNQLSEERLKKIPDLKNDFDKVSEKSDKLNVVFSESNILWLVEELERVAEATDNKISISVDEKENIKEVKKTSSKKEEDNEDKFLKTLPVDNFFVLNIVLQGKYDNMVEFVDKLDNLKYYNAIKSFDIASVEVEDDDLEKNDTLGESPATLVGGSNKIGTAAGNSKDGKILVLESKMAVLFYLNEKQDEEN